MRTSLSLAYVHLVANRTIDETMLSNSSRSALNVASYADACARMTTFTA